MRCIIYARYSTDRQSESSIADQVRVCTAYATAQDWTIAGEHSDRGISGAALGNRPGAQAALAELAAGDTLLLTDLTRLSRSQDLAPLLSRLRHRGVRVVGVQDGFDSQSRTARMQAGLSGILSEEFRAMISDRTHSSHEQRAREGKSTGGKPYTDQAILREIFTRFAGGESMRAICNDLNQRAIPSPGATWAPRAGVRGRWLVSALHAILKNERYAGRVIWNRSRWVKDPDTGRRLRRERPREEWIVREVEPLIDADTWARVQARFRPAVRAPKGGRRSYLLSGLLLCGQCGARLIVIGGGVRRYQCGQHHHGGPAACANGVTFTRLAAEQALLQPVIEQLLSPVAVKAGLKAMRAERAALERTPPPADDRELRELERLVRDGVLSEGVAAPALAEARRKAQAVRASEPLQASPWPTERLWRETVRELADVLRGSDVDAAREALRELIGEVRCMPDAERGVVAELAARSVLLAAGGGIWTGSGGALRIHIPTGRRRAAGGAGC